MLVEGIEKIKIHGEYFPVRAEIVNQDSLSAHADYQEILGWLKNFKHAPKEVFLTHGEPTAADSLRQKIEEEFRWNCKVPEYFESVNLS